VSTGRKILGYNLTQKFLRYIRFTEATSHKMFNCSLRLFFSGSSELQTNYKV